ncbi:PREDICTED: LOW QUALITY PROTEIN: sialate O-acetylesterase, partial [Mesitornis unicolor]|uniref:LOW QUALITY PROTEIN: sialate O-acetylesterase n=1 Tax=Mesitornis unicolor TaxID=54374 RepID=UPI000528892C
SSPSPHLSGPQMPSVLWNAMIHPLLNMTLHGIAWYQDGSCQGAEFPPISASQLSTYRRQSLDDRFARLRWHQTADLGVVPNARMPGTFMAVAMDLGEQHDEHSPYGSIHPRDKQSVAHRLQLGARAVAYGEKEVVFQGPYPSRAVLEVTKGCRWLPAPVVTVRSRTVTLALAGCRTPVLGLRYAWAEWPCDYQACALYNAGGLPAPPFLMDTGLGFSETASGRELLLRPGSWLSRGDLGDGVQEKGSSDLL